MNDLSEWMTIAEASHALGVGPPHVRRLARNGGLPAVRIGSGWLVSASAVAERAHMAPSAGRPLSAEMAWQFLRAIEPAVRFSSSGVRDDASGPAFPADRRVRHRVRRLLADPPPVHEWPHWLRRRAEARHVRAHPGVIARLRSDPVVRLGGFIVPVRAGSGLGAAYEDLLYVAEDNVHLLEFKYHLRPAVKSELILMVVPQRCAGELPPEGEPMPLAVSYVDMLWSLDARTRHLAETVLEGALDGVKRATG